MKVAKAGRRCAISIPWNLPSCSRYCTSQFRVILASIRGIYADKESCLNVFFLNGFVSTVIYCFTPSNSWPLNWENRSINPWVLVVGSMFGQWSQEHPRMSGVKRATWPIFGAEETFLPNIKYIKYTTKAWFSIGSTMILLSIHFKGLWEVFDGMAELQPANIWG